MYKLTRTVAIVSVIAGLLLIGSAAQAQLIGYWNAANPANSGTTVEDLSSSNYDMQLLDSVTDSGDFWSFPGNQSSYIEGTGNEAIYDFDTAQGTGGADPFTVVGVFDQNIVGDVFHTLVNKDDGNLLGWGIAPRGDDHWVDAYAIPGNNSMRMYDRHSPGASGKTLVVWHMDGSGTVDGSDIYVNDGAPGPVYQENNLSGSILNDEPIRIGSDISGGNHLYQGEIFWVQIWAGAESTLPGGSAAQLASDVWNNGDITPIVPEPTSMSLLLIGLIGLLGFGRRRRG